MRIRQLDHVALHVADLPRSCEFYTTVLQLSPLPRPAFDFPGAWFRIGDHQELHLIGERRGEVQSLQRGTHFAVQVDEIEDWAVHLERVGAQFLPKKRRPDGASQIFLQDPDGYFIELCMPSR